MNFNEKYPLSQYELLRTKQMIMNDDDGYNDYFHLLCSLYLNMTFHVQCKMITS